MSPFEVVTMSRAELDEVIEWAASEGWNPGLHDAATFHAADQGGFFLGKLEGEPVAAVSAVRYGAEFGFIGLYIVKPGHRDRGLGGHLLLRATEHLEGCRTIGLDGVETQQANYARHGARFAHTNIRFRGTGPGRVDAAVHAVDLSTIPWEEIKRFDRIHFPAPRAPFLTSWITQTGALSLGILSGGRLAACGVRRPCREGYKIGPLFADSPSLAADLLASLRGGLRAEESFYLDIPEPNTDATALASTLGMTPVFQTARMYLGETPSLPLERIYGITSYELG